MVEWSDVERNAQAARQVSSSGLDGAMAMTAGGIYEVLNDGNLNCEHPRIYYVDNAFDGQAFWCDVCPRHERMGYNPGVKMDFPPNALIRTPNPKYGGTDVYAWRAGPDGRVSEDLPEGKRIYKSALEITWPI